MSGTLSALTGGSTISFDEIAYTIARPQTIIEVAANYSNLGLLGFPAKRLLLGVKDAVGTATPGVPYLITRDGQAEALFGPASQLTEMVVVARLNDLVLPLWAMCGAVPAGSLAAIATMTFQGNALASGTVPYWVNDRYFALIVRLGDTPAIQAAAFAALVNADIRVPVTAAVAGAVVTLTARTAGAQGNSYTVSSQLVGNEPAAVPGVAATIVPFAGGAGVPDMTVLLAGIATTWFTDLFTAFADTVSLGILAAELERRYAATGRLDMHGYFGAPSTVGQALAAAASQNSRFLTRVPIISQSPPWKCAAAGGSVAAYQLAQDPARQLKTLPWRGIVAPLLANRHIETDDEALLNNGWSTYNVLSDGTVTWQRAITCYQFSAASIPDTAWRDIMRPKTMTRIRWDWANYLGLQYPRAKLADDNSVAAQFDTAVATPRRVWNSWVARCGLYEQVGWIENVDATSKQSEVVRDTSDHNRVNSRLVVQQLGNLMVFAGRLEFLA